MAKRTDTDASPQPAEEGVSPSAADEPVQLRVEGAVPPLLEQLLAVHSATSTQWLADGAATAAERGLGALYALLFRLDSSGGLVAERPASSARMRALAKLNQLLETNVSTLKFDPRSVPAVWSTLQEGRAVAVNGLCEALPLLLSEQQARPAQKQLGVGQVWLAPLHWSGESAGLLVLLMPADSAAPLAYAELLARHVAVALANLQTKEAGRRRGELDAVRWIYDEQRFEEQLSMEVRRAQRHKRPVSILLIRLENYHDLRVRYGRFLAERLLRQVAGALETTMRDTDFLGAFKDDGFAAILVEADAQAAERAKGRLLDGLASVSLPHAQLPDLRIELSCATASQPEDGQAADDLRAAAEGRLAPLAAAQEDVA